MRLVSQLCHLCKPVVLVMVLLWTWALSPVLTWLYRWLGISWRFIFARLRPVLVWKKHREDPKEKPIDRASYVKIEGCEYGSESGEESARSSLELGVSSAGGLESPGYEKVQEIVPEADRDDEGIDEFRADPSDEFFCSYDSTWESDPISKPKKTHPSPKQGAFRRFENAARDMCNYRHDYPTGSQFYGWDKQNSFSSDEQNDMPNLDFYLGKTPSRPDGVYISNFHNDWQGAYDKLEHVHSYIQWLFPLQEPGMNFEAIPMTKKEVLAFRESSAAKENLFKSYKLMLDFYGIELCDEKTGEVKRAKNWRARFKNLNCRTHNNLRLTRILKCLGTLGFADYQAPLVRFFLEMTLVDRELPNVKDSALNYFVFAVRDKRQRRRLIKFAYLKYHNKEEFVWCPKNIQGKLSGGGKLGWKSVEN